MYIKVTIQEMLNIAEGVELARDAPALMTTETRSGRDESSEVPLPHAQGHQCMHSMVHRAAGLPQRWRRKRHVAGKSCCRLFLIEVACQHCWHCFCTEAL